MPTYELFAWGANSHGQLGLETQTEQSLIPQKVNLSRINLKPEKIKKIVGGAGHTILLDTNGNLYSCGWNHRGQLGINGKKDISSFCKIDALNGENIIDVACGWDSSVALSINGTVFAWGSNSYGQLGMSNKNLNFFEQPFQISINEKIQKIAMGLRHTALITEKGTLLMSGAGNNGQLGLVNFHNKSIKQTYTFSEVAGLSKVIDVSCGQYHTIIITEDKDVFVWGNNKYGQLGVDSTTYPKISFPKKLQNIDFTFPVALHCGWTHCVILNGNDGKVITWGRNIYGQLGHENLLSSKPDYVKNIPKIQELSVGSEHSVVITDKRMILSWGWNEHGNCGNGKIQNVYIPEFINLPFNYNGIIIGCGAGHSFAVVEIKI